MTLCRVTDTVYAIYDRIKGGIITNGCVCALEVIVDSAWQTDAAYVVVSGKIHGTRQ